MKRTLPTKRCGMNSPRIPRHIGFVNFHSLFSVLFSWLSLLCEITYRHHLAVVSVRRKRYKAIIRIWPLNSLILLKNLGGHHLLLIISFHQKTLFLFQQEFLQSIEDRFLCICCQEAVSQPITVECGHSTCKVCQIILSIKHLVFVESIFFMTLLKFLEIFYFLKSDFVADTKKFLTIENC